MSKVRHRNAIRKNVVLLASVACALTLLGCHSKDSNAYSRSSSLENVRPVPAFVPTPALEDTPVAVQEPAPAQVPEARAALFNEPVYGGLDTAQLDLFFRPLTDEGPKSRPVQKAPAKSEKIQAEAAWNVPLQVKWRHIVIHHSASAKGSAAIFHREHLKRGWDGLGYHFVIGNGTASRDGEVEVGYRWNRQARGAHAGNKEYNVYGIGICLVGNFEESRPTERQMAKLRSLVRFLQWKAKIPTSHIIGHGDVPNKDTQCPGRYFNVAQFRSTLGSAEVLLGASKTAQSSSSSKMVSRVITNGSATP